MYKCYKVKSLTPYIEELLGDRETLLGAKILIAAHTVVDKTDAKDWSWPHYPNKDGGEFCYAKVCKDLTTYLIKKIKDGTKTEAPIISEDKTIQSILGDLI